ncbi:MAG: hypothetical protein QGG42_00605 [Phycisphaerae bacterium]|nr:hypothetical protein [Phycisphaerae bacterium]
MAQLRRSTGIRLRNIGALKEIGRGQNYEFNLNSAGGGGLQSGGGYEARGVLRSAMASDRRAGRGLVSGVGRGRQGTTSLASSIDKASSSRVGGASGFDTRVVSPSLSPDTLKTGSTLKGGSGITLEGAGGRGMASVILGKGMSLAAAREFIASVGESSSLKKPDESIKTLVPDQPGQYRDKMHRGEELLRAGSYLTAYDQFKLASDIVGRSPEPYLNMAHAKFGSGGYSMTAFYIRRALVCMPQLPAVPLRPKKFYPNVAVFGDLIIRLESQLDERPGDGDALLILAYFRWFADTPDVSAVRSALEKALAVAKSEERIEAIHIFWRAIVDTGKATGKLRGATSTPSSGGSSTTKPAGKAAESSDKALKSSVEPGKTGGAADRASR